MSVIGIGGVGCSLLDVLYPDATIESATFDRYASRTPGDGGLAPGKLVFAEHLESFSGVSLEQIQQEVGGATAPAQNLGGPAVVPLVHAAQVLAPLGIPVRFAGFYGDDEYGAVVTDIVGRTPLLTGDYRRRPGATPHTIVLSDPTAANGAGERTFVNRIGVAGEYRVADIPREILDQEIVYFGGTALVPALHAELGAALREVRRRGGLTIVATVYDFLNESRAPDQLWPLGDGQRDYPLIDLLIVDREEARRLTGEDQPAAALARFAEWGAGAAVVTDGGAPIHFRADRGRFAACPTGTLPVSAEVGRRAGEVPPSERDTTGCGDNFAGGVLADIAMQMAATGSGVSPAAPLLDLRAAVMRGVASGAAAWFYLGGTWIEQHPGEKAEMVDRFYRAYLEQLQASG